MNRYAISFTVKPGTEPEVAEVLRGYRRPPAGAAGGDPGGGGRANGPPLLRRTSVFMTGQRVVRVIDVDGDIGTVMRHLAAQPQVRAVEEALDPYLVTPRDLRSPEGVQAFLHHALLRLTRHGALRVESEPDVQRRERCGLLYPVRTGHGARAARLLANAAESTITFRSGDVLVGLLEVDGSVAGALDQLARDASRTPSAAALTDVLETGEDLTTVTGFRSLLEDCRMELLTDRRVGVPA